jgi:hypothetical protein
MYDLVCDKMKEVLVSLQRPEGMNQIEREQIVQCVDAADLLNFAVFELLEIKIEQMFD